MSDEQLGVTLADIEKHLFQLRFQSATDRLETPSEIRKAKRDIARIRTIMREKELRELEALPADQLATRIAALDKKKADNAPGKRTAHRRSARLKRFYTNKGGKLPIAPPAVPSATPQAATGTKTEAKKGETKKAAPAKGSGK